LLRLIKDIKGLKMGIDLITLQEYKSFAGITSTTQDTTIKAIIPKVSDLVKSLCRRTFVDYVNDSKTEVFKGGYALNLSEYPVLTVDSVEYSADFGANYISLTEYTDWALDVEEECIVPTASLGVFPKGVNAYRVTYTAGYTTLPTDLKLAIFDLVSYYLKNDAAVHNSRSPSGNTVQIQYIMSTALPSNIQRVLDLYKANYS
jgi:hypothetical protein